MGNTLHLKKNHILSGIDGDKQLLGNIFSS